MAILVPLPGRELPTTFLSNSNFSGILLAAELPGLLELLPGLLELEAGLLVVLELLAGLLVLLVALAGLLDLAEAGLLEGSIGELSSSMSSSMSMSSVSVMLILCASPLV